jgi:hypothetical protein
MFFYAIFPFLFILGKTTPAFVIPYLPYPVHYFVSLHSVICILIYMSALCGCDLNVLLGFNFVETNCIYKM